MSDIKRNLTALGDVIEKMIADHEAECLRLSGLLAEEKRLRAHADGEREKHYHDAVQALQEARRALDENEDLRARVRELEARLFDRVDSLEQEHITEAAE